jgi:hypothetical protein
MVIAYIKINNGFELYCTGKNENNIRDKVFDFLKERFFSESVFITDFKIIACSEKFMSETLLLK